MNFILKKENFFILCFLSLLLSLYFGENSSGGAYKDFLSTQKYLSVFQNDILNGFKVFILEDRKFADIGHIFQKQFVGGIYRIQSWCHLITMHSLMGQGALQTFEQCADLETQGVLLIKEMSNSGNWLDEEYSARTLWLARMYPKLVSGFIGQDKKADVAVPLLVETIRIMSPNSQEGKEAYERLIQLGFVETKYKG